MANSPVDKSNEFIKSGMTLITDRASDKYLSKINKDALSSMKCSEQNPNQK
jgi:hypothetical protein